MEKEEFEFALQVIKYLKKELTAEEETHFLEQLDQDEKKKGLLEYYQGSGEWLDRFHRMEKLNLDLEWERFSRRTHSSKYVIKTLIKYAAILISVVAVSFLFYKSPSKDHAIVADITGKYHNDVLPPDNMTRLKLANGKTLSLHATEFIINKRGEIMVNGKTLATGLSQEADQSDSVIYHTLEVPKGTTSKVILGDGTQIYLNASSKLQFPLQFTGKERSVSLEGEGFFDVTKNSDMPFTVLLNGASIDVLGTTFNISSHQNNMRTTLIEGAILFRAGAQTIPLKPGQEVVANEKILRIEEADLEKTLAWKEGYFHYNGADLVVVLKELADWYDLDLDDTYAIPNKHFSGDISRTGTLTEALNLLERAGEITFDLKGRKLAWKPRK